MPARIHPTADVSPQATVGDEEILAAFREIVARPEGARVWRRRLHASPYRSAARAHAAAATGSPRASWTVFFSCQTPG